MSHLPAPPDAPPPSTLANDLARGRTHLGNERTHLAYLRTTVSLIGFGITINRFSTYLIQNDQARSRGEELSSPNDRRSWTGLRGGLTC